MKKIYSLLLLLLSYYVNGQISFTAIPMDSSLIARDLKSNLGTILIQGKVNNTSTAYDSLCLKTYRNSVLKDSVYQDLSYSSGLAPFNLSYQIPAELDEYAIKIYGVKNKVQTLDTIINGIVAGDVYIIEGQSNAFALMRDGGSANGNKSEFIRSFASSDSNTAGFLTYLKWGIGDGDGNGSVTGHNYVGQWGLRLARLLVDSMKIPIAIFNGACGGTPISYYERPSNYKTNLNSNYAREYYRLQLTGLQNNVRAIIWSQGETDAKNGTSISTYVNEFDTLEKAWKQDYPELKKTYVFQTRNGGMPSYPFLNLQEMKEAEREIAIEHDSDIEIMSTSALRQDSGDLHFDYKGGYEEFGNRVYNLIARDLYAITPTREIDAPMITSAYLSDSTTLVVAENADSLMRHNTDMPIQDYEIENASGAVIDTIFLNKNKIIFQLSKYPGTGVTVSYLAQPADSGNWLTNTNNIEVLCFYKYPVDDSIAVLTGITSSGTPISMKVYPNPFHQLTTIAMGNTGTYFVEIDDIMGRQLKEEKFTGNQYLVNAEGLTNGIYFLRLFDEEKNLIGVTKVIIQ
jgi:hypothetical protein